MFRGPLLHNYSLTILLALGKAGVYADIFFVRLSLIYESH